MESAASGGRNLEQMDAEMTLTCPLDIREMVDKLFDYKVAELREARKQRGKKKASLLHKSSSLQSISNGLNRV